MSESTDGVLAFKNQAYKHMLSKKVAVISIFQTISIFQGM